MLRLVNGLVSHGLIKMKITAENMKKIANKPTKNILMYIRKEYRIALDRIKSYAAIGEKYTSYYPSKFITTSEIYILHNLLLRRGFKVNVKRIDSDFFDYKLEISWD